jgi:hypothetical protein
VVEQGDAEQLPHVDQALRQGAVFLAGLRRS